MPSTRKSFHNVKNRNKEYIEDYKRQNPCVICGENRTPALCFHHKDRDNKDFNITVLQKWASIDRIKKEIDKCIVLCANCHQILHYNERQ